MMRSPFMLKPGWFEPNLQEALAPNLIAEAARDLGIIDDRVRMALADATEREGQPTNDWNLAAEIGAKAGGLDKAKLLERAKSPEIEARARASTAEFHAFQVTQRPTFVVDSERSIVVPCQSAELLTAQDPSGCMVGEMGPKNPADDPSRNRHCGRRTGGSVAHRPVENGLKK